MEKQENPSIDRSEPVVIPSNTEPEQPTATDADAVEEAEAPEPATEGEETPENSSSTEEDTTDYESLIAAERKGGEPDLEKARERFLKKRQEEQQQEEQQQEPEDDLDKPMTKREAEEYFARQRQNLINEANQERLAELYAEQADNDRQAQFIQEVHRNRIWPEGMSLRDQVAEAKAIADYKRLQVKNAELGRKLQSHQTASKNTASTQRDPQAALAPGLPADVKGSLKRAGYAWNGQTKRYEKTLPNGKVLATRDGKNPQLVG